MVGVTLCNQAVKGYRRRTKYKSIEGKNIAYKLAKDEVSLERDLGMQVTQKKNATKARNTLFITTIKEVKAACRTINATLSVGV